MDVALAGASQLYAGNEYIPITAQALSEITGISANDSKMVMEMISGAGTVRALNSALESLAAAGRLTQTQVQAIRTAYPELAGTGRPVIVTRPGTPVADDVVLAGNTARPQVVGANSPHLSAPQQGGTLNIGAGNKPIEGAYNISSPSRPMGTGVHPGNAENLSGIASGSQKTIIMENPFGFDPLNPEVLRVLADDGQIIIRGNESNKFVRHSINAAQERGLTLVSQRRVDNIGYYQSDGIKHVGGEIIEYTFTRGSVK